MVQLLKRLFGRHTLATTTWSRLRLWRSETRCNSDSATVRPGNVSPVKSVPDSIQKPPYINQSWIQAAASLFSTRDIEIKTDRQIQRMRDACAFARDVLNSAGEIVAPGVTTEAIDCFVHELCIKNNAYPSPLLYKGFPKSVCTSVNNVACHGIPDDRPLQCGDIVNIDITVYYNGFHGDTSKTFCVGDVNLESRRLVRSAEQSRDAAIAICGPGVPFRAIGKTITNLVSLDGFEIIEAFCGHGIGDYFHGLPDIIHIDNDLDGVMEEGMTFTIEPVVSGGGSDFIILSDGWTAVSKDDSWSAQFEHTVLVTAHGVDILTK